MTRTGIVAIAIAGSLVMMPSTAAADVDDEYTAIIMGVDLGVIAGGALALKVDDWYWGPTIGLYTFGGPIVHAVHGDFAEMGKSFGVRLAGPATGIIVGYIFDPGMGTPGQAIGALVGVGAAMAIDWLVLSKGWPFTSIEDSGGEPQARLVSFGGRF